MQGATLLTIAAHGLRAALDVLKLGDVLYPGVPVGAALVPFALVGGPVVVSWRRGAAPVAGYFWMTSLGIAALAVYFQEWILCALVAWHLAAGSAAWACSGLPRRRRLADACAGAAASVTTWLYLFYGLHAARAATAVSLAAVTCCVVIALTQSRAVRAGLTCGAILATGGFFALAPEQASSLPAAWAAFTMLLALAAVAIPARGRPRERSVEPPP